MFKWRIPLSDLDYGGEEREAVLRVLDSKWLSMGPEVAKYEAEFAKLIEMNHCVAVANGTAALHLAFLSLGFGRGDEVIQPALNFVAAANMTVASGATPVFADIVDLAEPTIDPTHVESLITPRTKAVIVMHYGGYLCRMADLWSICRKHGLALIEDACHAVGTKYIDSLQRPPHGKMAGNVGDIAAMSTFSNKNIATGEGGVVMTNDDALASKLRSLRSHGMTTLTWDRYNGHASSYEVVANGYNYRLDELHAALGRAQLAKLMHNNERRRRLLAIYHQQLRKLPGWIIPFADSGAETSGHLMVAIAPTWEIRSQVVHKLGECGVQTSLHYPCICDFTAFARCQKHGVDLSRQFASRAITLPLFPSLPASEVNLICQTIGDCLH